MIRTHFFGCLSTRIPTKNLFVCIIIIYEVINQGLEGWDDKGALDDKGPTKSVHHYRNRDSDISINYYIFSYQTIYFFGIVRIIQIHPVPTQSEGIAHIFHSTAKFYSAMYIYEVRPYSNQLGRFVCVLIFIDDSFRGK